MRTGRPVEVLVQPSQVSEESASRINGRPEFLSTASGLVQGHRGDDRVDGLQSGGILRPSGGTVAGEDIAPIPYGLPSP